jgi:hypothetical protein
MENPDRSELTKFVIPATIMLSFISFWRAAAIVLFDLGSSAYYVGGIAEQAIGKAAPWFVLGSADLFILALPRDLIAISESKFRGV